MYNINDYLTAKKIASNWKISNRMVIKYCTDGLIEGTVKKGNIWLIPNMASKPKDKDYPEFLMEHSAKYEDEKIEWEESWRVEYLQTFSAFANSFEGKFYIGINDDGKTTGIKDIKKLMEDIPNQSLS